MITTSCTTSSVQRRTVLRVRAGAGEWRGPWQRRRESFRILARSAEGRGRSTGPVARPDSTLLSVLPFMDNSVCDGGHIHSEVSSQPSSRSCHAPLSGLAAARARSQWRSASCQLWLARLPLPRLQIQSQRGLASLRRHSCLAGACGAMLSCGSLRLSFLSVRLPWWRWVQPSRVSSLTAPRSSFDCLASSTGAGTRESAHSQSNWCALNVCCRRGSAGSAHRCGPGRPTRQHLRYCSAADASMVGRHCEANNPASYASVVTVAVVWGASLALSLMPVRFPRLGQMPSGSPSSPTSAMEAGSRHMVESGVDRTQTDAFCFSSSRAVPATHTSAHRRPAPSV